MPEEAFALSPISARASLPSEADYEAIREAFMETARGRWFLAEYAKRNRNADTSMVLEAVTRMEANLAAQKKAPAIVSLIAALGAIRLAIRDAKVIAAEAMPRAADDETLAAASNGARIIREIAWTLRECGADIRICDLLDAQVKAIEAGQSHSDLGDARVAVLASFDTLVQRIEQLASGDAAPAAATPARPAEQPVEAAKEPEASVTPLFRSPAEEPAEVALDPGFAEPTPPAEAAAAPAEMDVAADAAVPADDAATPETQQDDMTAPTLASIAAAVDETAAQEEAEAVADMVAAMDADAQAEDLAVLDMVAAEMAAADFSAPELAPTMDVSPAAEPDVIAEEPELQPAPAATPYHPSLGAALLASGVVPHPSTPASDQLTPIRRMSQAEKIAFFS